MKLSLNGDFTRLAKVVRVRPAGPDDPIPFAFVRLEHDDRHLRRKVLNLSNGEQILVDLPQAVRLAHDDRLVLEDGRMIAVEAADEALLEITPRDARHQAELAWHLGNRHLAAEIRDDRILVAEDHVIKAMLEGLGATVTRIVAPFHPLRGAYAGDGHAHSVHSHNHGEDHHHHEH